MNISWADKKIAAPLAVETSKMVEASVAKMTTDNATTMRNAADYMQGKGKLDQALKPVNTSIAGAETFRNVWVKAQILSKLGNFAEAVPLAQKAMELGKGDSSFGFFKDAIEKGVTDWTAKLPVAMPTMPGKKKK